MGRYFSPVVLAAAAVEVLEVAVADLVASAAAVPGVVGKELINRCIK